MGTANFFGFIITAERLPQTLAELIVGYTDSQIVVMFLILAMLLVIGTFLDNVTALVLIVPTLLNVVQTLQIDLVFFGIFTVIALAVGQFTPPVGLNLFIASNVAHEKFENVVVQTVPYLIAYIVMLIVFIFVPQLLTVFA